MSRAQRSHARQRDGTRPAPVKVREPVCYAFDCFRTETPPRYVVLDFEEWAS